MGSTVGCERPSTEQRCCTRSWKGLRSAALNDLMAASDHGLDVIRGRAGGASSETVVFPGAGGWVPLTRFTGERPNPLDQCPGYQERPSAGLPVIILFPTSFRFAAGATAELRGASGQHFRTLDGNLCSVHASSNRIFLIANEALESGEWKATYRIRTGQTLTWCFGVYEPSEASVPLKRLGGCEEYSARPALQSSAFGSAADASQSSSSYTAVSAGYAPGEVSICVLRVDGLVECRGQGLRRDIPDGPFTVVAAGSLGSCGLRPDGRIECWGYLYSGLTHGGIPEVPQGTFTALDIGRQHSCAVRSDGVIKCWLDWADDSYGNDYGQADPPAGTFTDVAAGWSHTCGIRVAAPSNAGAESRTIPRSCKRRLAASPRSRPEIRSPAACTPMAPLSVGERLELTGTR